MQEPEDKQRSLAEKEAESAEALASQYELSSDEKLVEGLLDMEPALAAKVILELPEERPQRILAHLPDAKLYRMLKESPDDVAVDLIGLLPYSRQEALLEKYPDLVPALEELLKYPAETAGGIMTSDYVALPENLTVEEVVRILRRRQHLRKGRPLQFIYTLDEEGKLNRQIPIMELLISPPDRKLADLEGEKALAVDQYLDQEEAAKFFREHDLTVLPVVDAEGRPVGVITADDVIEVIEEESEEDLLRFGGVSQEESVLAPTRQVVKNRLPWLMVNLATAFLAASVVRYYQGTIAQAVMLAVFMPVIAGMGGNAATQALAVTVRGLALGELTFQRFFAFLLKEVKAGLINGLVIAATAGVVASLVTDNWWFVLVVFLAMWGNHIIAALAGSSIPLVLKALGVDPAVASSVFVTTFTDLFGFFFLLGLSTVLLLPRL